MSPFNDLSTRIKTASLLIAFFSLMLFLLFIEKGLYPVLFVYTLITIVGAYEVSYALIRKTISFEDKIEDSIQRNSLTRTSDSFESFGYRNKFSTCLVFMKRIVSNSRALSKTEFLKTFFILYIPILFMLYSVFASNVSSGIVQNDSLSFASSQLFPLHKISVLQKLLFCTLFTVFLSIFSSVCFIVFSGRKDISGISSSLVVHWNVFIALVIYTFGAICLQCFFVTPLLLLYLVIVVCCNDSVAYFGGKKYGKHKLAPGVSPNKTIEGTVLGLLGGVLAGIILLQCYTPSILILTGMHTPARQILVSILIVIGAQIGDLLKSILKRSAGVKDFSNLLPGHGGILDRLDGVFGASIVLTIFITGDIIFFNQGLF
jgi:CDP-diglyceride synthetase